MPPANDKTSIDPALCTVTPERLAVLNPIYGEAVALAGERYCSLEAAVGVLILAELRAVAPPRLPPAILSPRPRRKDNDDAR